MLTDDGPDHAVSANSCKQTTTATADQTIGVTRFAFDISYVVQVLFTGERLFRTVVNTYE
jgi:hypothetical protein